MSWLASCWEKDFPAMDELGPPHAFLALVPGIQGWKNETASWTLLCTLSVTLVRVWEGKSLVILCTKLILSSYNPKMRSPFIAGRTLHPCT